MATGQERAELFVSKGRPGCQQGCPQPEGRLTDRPGRAAGALPGGTVILMHPAKAVHLLDLGRLEQLSRELAGAADELAVVRSALQARAAGLRWHSGAARAFQAVLHELLGQLGQSGSRLSELCGAVRAHQQRAAGRAASVAQLGSASLDLIERAVRLP